jgi:hypothetical protein
MKKHLLFTCCILFILPASLFAQRVMISARGTLQTPGAAIAVFTDKTAAVEAMYSYITDKNRHLFSSLYTEHYPIKKIKQLSWCWGAGLHIGFSKEPRMADHPKPAFGTVEIRKVTRTVGGTNVMFGLHYDLNRIPVFIGFDIKPYVNFVNEESKFWDGAARIGIIF